MSPIPPCRGYEAETSDEPMLATLAGAIGCLHELANRAEEVEQRAFAIAERLCGFHEGERSAVGLGSKASPNGEIETLHVAVIVLWNSVSVLDEQLRRIEGAVG